jgi:hypothetical protein
MLWAVHLNHVQETAARTSSPAGSCYYWTSPYTQYHLENTISAPKFLPIHQGNLQVHGEYNGYVMFKFNQWNDSSAINSSIKLLY